MPIHSFDIGVAKDLGVNAAIVLYNLGYLQSQREAQGGDDYFFDGKWWVRHSYESLAKHHAYLSVQQIRRIMGKLEELGMCRKRTMARTLGIGLHIGL